MDMILRASGFLIQRLAWSSLQTTVLIGVVWLLVRYLPRLTPAVRAMLWWLVAAQLLAGLMVSAPLQLPLLPAHVATAAVATPRDTPATASHAVVSIPDGGSQPGRAIDQRITSTAAGLPWQAILAAVWLAAVSMLLVLTARSWWRMRRVLQRAAMPHDPLLQNICRQRARALGLRRCPQLRVSGMIDAPQVTGLWRPVILLPGRHRLSHDEAVMALIHELSHVRRGDLWLGWVPALAQRLFFFHPLVAWAMREYAMHREVACDTEVLRQRWSTPQTYGHLLMRLGITQPTPASLSGASPTFRHLKRRLTMLQQPPDFSPHRLRHVALVIAIAVAGIIPYRVTARPTQTAPAPATSTHVHSHTQGNASARSLPPPPAPPTPPPASPMTPPAPPAPPAPPSDAGGHFRNVSIDTGSHRHQGFVLIDGDSMQVVGSQDDMRFAKTVAPSTHTPTLWLRQGSQRYVTHDPSTIDRIRKAYAPLTKAAEDEGKLAGREGELAGRESGLAAQEGALASLRGQLAGRRGELAARRAALASQQGRASAEQRARIASLKAQEVDLHRDMARLKARQSVQRKRLDAQRHALAGRRKAIAGQREVLSKQREQAAKMASRQVKAVLSDALKQGKFTRQD